MRGSEVVQFKNGKYGVRFNKGLILPYYEYLDLELIKRRGVVAWRERANEFYRDCQGTLDEANGALERLTDAGRPIS